jgi:hypothetical protein
MKGSPNERQERTKQPPKENKKDKRTPTGERIQGNLMTTRMMMVVMMTSRVIDFLSLLVYLDLFLSNL